MRTLRYWKVDKDSKIFVAGHTGLVGSAIVRKLREEGYDNLVLRTHKELDLTKQDDVSDFFTEHSPDYVFLAAAKVGGIMANSTYPADFIRDNLLIQTNIIHNSYLNSVRKLLFLGSSCIYPKLSKQPITEDSLLTGLLEPTNDAYAIAKIAGIKMCQSYNRQHGTNFICAMPTNLYGPNDNFDPETSHVLPALILKFHQAKAESKESVTVWGTGKPLREFLYVDDLADACLFLMEEYDGSDIVNVGVGKDISIADLAKMISDVVGYEGYIVFDDSKPDGTPKKLLDVSKLVSMGWTAKTDLREGIKKSYSWYLENH